MTALHRLQNAHWQVGVLPETGASLAFARIRYNGVWLDVMRPTAEADYDNSSKCGGFIMLPWANRIRGGSFTFEGETHQLDTTPDDGTARHGDVRKRIWEVDEAHSQHLHLTFDSSAHHQLNFPFPFSATAEYTVDENTFTLRITVTNEGTRRMPFGFGHHPYFVRPGGDNTPLLHIPCHRYFELHDLMPTAASQPLTPNIDFRTLRRLDEGHTLDHLLTERMPDDPIKIVYPAWKFALEMRCDQLFKHVVAYTPDEEPSVAIEPMTIATDGFNLMQQGIEGHGTIILEPGELQSAAIHLSFVPYEG